MVSASIWTVTGTGLRIRRALEPTAGPLGEEAVVLVAHGSQCAGALGQTEALVEQVAGALGDTCVKVGYLEMADPPAGKVIDDLASAGVRRIFVMPLVLFSAGHAKSDLPALVLRARHSHPRVEVVLGAPLGVSRALVEAVAGQVERSGGSGLPLLVVSRGSSDPEANAEAAKAARLVAEWTHARMLQVGYSGLTWPTVSEAATNLAQLGAKKVALCWWYLFHGRLVEKGLEALGQTAEREGLELLDAGPIGPGPALAKAVVARYQEARQGDIRVSCDLCPHRAPWPGLEQRVGQPIGVGHSHLAREHLHSH